MKKLLIKIIVKTLNVLIQMFCTGINLLLFHRLHRANTFFGCCSLLMLQQVWNPFSSASRFSALSSASGIPLLYLKALTVVTITTAPGFIALYFVAFHFIEACNFLYYFISIMLWLRCFYYIVISLDIATFNYFISLCTLNVLRFYFISLDS